jgi:hypothetical protein
VSSDSDPKFSGVCVIGGERWLSRAPLPHAVNGEHAYTSPHVS